MTDRIGSSFAFVFRGMQVLLVLVVALGLAKAAVPSIQKGGVDSSVPKRESRIVGGEQASVGMFQYQVGLILSNGTAYNWCGGCLISKDWILTAAHCTYGMVSVTVLLGTLKIPQAEQIVNSTTFFVHEEYSPQSPHNDISLIQLPTPVTFSDLVQPAVLPRRLGTISNYYGDTVIASGWGSTNDSSTNVTEDLNFIFRKVTSNIVCKLAYGLNFVKDSQLCVDTSDEENNKSTCNGDSGGPLVLNDYQRTLIGLTSYGHIQGCDMGYPVVFTRITSYLEWIKNISGVYNN